MADFTLTPTPPLAGYDRSFGATRLMTIPDLAIVSLALPLGQEAAALAKITSVYGVDLPAPGLSVTTKTGPTKTGTRLVRLSTDQALVMFTHSEPDAERVVRDQIGGAAYTTDQTDAWVALALQGAGSVAALERMSMLDLHPDAFQPNRAARTVMEHLGVLIIRVAAEDWVLLGASSSAQSFLHAVETSLVNTQ